MTEQWRSVKQDEIDVLISQGNSHENWEQVKIQGDLPLQGIWNCRFYGALELVNLEYRSMEREGRRYSSGLYNSCIHDCRIERDGTIIDLGYIRGYSLEPGVLLSRIDEMIHLPGSSFGQGFNPDSRLEIANESGSRWILPFAGMNSLDARLWSKLRGTSSVLEKFESWTRDLTDPSKNRLAKISRNSIIKNCSTISNIQVLGESFISGATLLKELTLLGTEKHGVTIEEGSHLQWGVLKEGSRVSASTAEHFFLSAHSKVTKGARLFHSFLSENSTFSCGEMVSSFCGPFHEQHHNNSFLIASSLEGQSNMAAGVSIGSNHNSRSADGEIRINRGFWPGLMTSLKHNSRIASFCLVAGSHYTRELHIPIPFSLVSQTEDELWLRPAYWQQYNMYALCRNSWKYHKRDKVDCWSIPMEKNWLAPDTADEIVKAMDLLYQWMEEGEYNPETQELLLRKNPLEKSKRPLRIFKPELALSIYRSLLNYYLAESLVMESKIRCDETTEGSHNMGSWHFLGGCLINDHQLDSLIGDIEKGIINSWQEMHDRYEQWKEEYPLLRAAHAKGIQQGEIQNNLESALHWEKQLIDRIMDSRKKDVHSPFRCLTYDETNESEALLPKLEEDPFIQECKMKYGRKIKALDEMISRHSP